MMSAGAGASYGVIDIQIGKSAALTVLTRFAALTRAREYESPIPASCETELRRADRPARAGCAAAD